MSTGKSLTPENRKVWGETLGWVRGRSGKGRGQTVLEAPFLKKGVLSVFCFCETELHGAEASLRLTTHLDLLRAGTAGVHRQVSFMQGWGLNPAWHL